MTMATKLCTCAGVALALGSVAFAQTGETCGDAIPVSEGSFNFDSTGFTNDGNSSCGDGGSADIWFAYTPTTSDNVTITTCGSSFDTILSAYSDCGGAELDCNDDSCGVQSIITTLPVTQGVTIFLRVAEYGLDSTGGAGVINISVVSPPPPTQWDEQVNGGGDAGDQLASAQTPTGTDPLTSMSGAIDFEGDVDLYLINVCDPASFSATTYQNDDAGLDTRMFLFKTDGTGVTFDDDVPDGYPGDQSLTSRVSGQFVPSPGAYYLAVTSYDVTPLDADGNALWNEMPYNVERAPDGPGAASALASWDFSFADTDSYRIALTGACFASGGGSMCDPDVNQDGNADQGDVDYLINVVAGGDNPTSIDPDFNHDGNVDQGDIDALVNVIAGGNCP